MLPVIVWVLSVLACVVVVLTRVRLGASGAGARKVSASVLNVHTAAGSVAALAWFAHLATGSLLAGFVGLLGWWTTALAGAALASRWLPARGRHVDDTAEDDWAAGGWLSQMAHVGLFVGVSVFTVAYVFGAV